MSVYRDTNSPVVFEHPFEGPLTASVYRRGVKIAEATGLTPVAGKYTLNLTYRETQFDGELEVLWTGLDGAVPFERKQSIEVITPLVSTSRLRTVFEHTNMGDAQLRELEGNVRLVIEAYTGQKFGYYVGTRNIVGTGEKTIMLPERLAKLYTVTGGPASIFTLSADGWNLHINYKNWLRIKEMPPEEFIDNVQLVSGVIHVPDVYWRNFHKGTVYSIDGEWGWPSVPEDVQEAAVVLAYDFGTGENLYRDKYLEVIKAGDWNLGYSPGAYRGTGNARADNILEKYRRQGMIVI